LSSVGGMGAFPRYTKTALLVGVLAFVVFLLFENGPIRLPLHIDGHVDPRFERVKLVFTQNFIDGWERGGASLAVYHHGEKVVDIWGGYADRSALRTWKEDTLQVVFSTTKGISAVCVAMLVDRGLVSYDDLVIKHWPEFGQNGKDNVTVQMLMSHAAGLSYLEENFSVEDAMDHKKVSKAIEKQKPHWPPGTRSGYHIYSHGWLVDQLIRRVDTKKRGIGQFVKEELHDKHNIDFHVGLPNEEMVRVARLTAPSTLDRLSEVMTDYRVVKYFKAIKNLVTDSMLSRALRNLPWLECVYQMTVNNPDFWRVEQAAALGVGNARSLAKTFSLVGQKKVVSQKTLDLLQVSHYRDDDLMMNENTIKGNGLFFTPLNRGKAQYHIGHTGHGCQQVLVDLGNGLSIGYTNNALKTALGDLCRTWKRLQNSIYESLDL
ncbi:hypothetical protein PFISCL1PPCAC_8089, partial [Pristionchus fissidentatus]